MKLSVIIPVYNEVRTIGKILDEIKNLDLSLDKEIIIVDDGSDDGTRELLLKIKGALTAAPDMPQCTVKTLFHDKNKGKTEAIKTALSEASGEAIIIQDADLEYLPSKNYKILLEPILEGWADVVYGSRFLGAHRVFYFWHYLANKFLTALTNVLFDTMLSDMESGAKAFKKQVFDNIKLTSLRFGFEPEITAKIFKRRLRVYEVPIYYCGRDYKQGKKIKPLDGIKAIFSLFKYRFID